MLRLAPGGREVLAIGYRALLESPLASRLTISEQEFVDSTIHYHVIGLYDNLKPVGMFFYEENRIHIAILPEYRGKWAHLFDDIIQYGINKFGSVIAKIHKDNKYTQRLATRYGFHYIKHEDDYIIYQIGEICLEE